MRDLVTKGIGWTFVQQWGVQLLSLIGFAIIARLVAPDDVGLVALASVFVLFAQIFVDSGMSAALIQRPVLVRGHIDTAFWLSVVTGCALAAVGVILAPLLSAPFNEPRLTPILQVLSLSFVPYGLASVQNALLRREMDQRSLAIRSLVAVAGGAVVGVALAYRGFGAWALVAQQLTAAALSVVTLWRASPWRPGRQVSRTHFDELFSFGANVVGSNVLTFLSRRTDNLLVGIYLGATQLGVYSVAYRVLDAAQAMVGGIAIRLAFPAFSRLQHDRERLASAFLRVDRVTTALVLPSFLGLSMVAPELITVIFGDSWRDAGPVAAVLFLIGAVYSVAAFSSAAFNGAGYSAVTLRLQLIGTITNVVGFFIAAAIFGSLIAVAVAFVLRGYLLLALNLYWLRRYVGVSLRRYFLQLRGVAVGSLAMAFALQGLKLVLVDRLSLPLLLGAETVIGALVFVGVLRVVDPLLLRELVDFARSALLGRRKKAKPGPRPDVEVDPAEVAGESHSAL